MDDLRPASRKRNRFHFGILVIIGNSCTKEEPDLIPTDYSDASHWLSIPSINKPVDVFYVYPTAWHKTDSSKPNVCAIDHPMMLPDYLKEHPKVYERMIAAYAIGYPVT